MMACSAESNEANDEMDIMGNIVEVDRDKNSILVEDNEKG